MLPKTVMLREETMTKPLKGERPKGLGLTRRQLLSRSVAAGASFVVGAGFVASGNNSFYLSY